jgi:hypothetical protein
MTVLLTRNDFYSIVDAAADYCDDDDDDDDKAVLQRVPNEISTRPMPLTQ